MACLRRFEQFVRRILGRKPLARNESGIALFMVMAALAILSVVVSEFTYVAQVNARMAVNSVDSIRAHYLAKTGLKISLLRLRAYMTLRNFSKKQGGSGGGGFQLPSELLEKIWSFPFVYPIPKELPGMTISMKDDIAKFEKESGLMGSFSATIESDSNRINLNSMLEDFAAQPSPSPSPSGGAASRRTPNPNPSASPTYDPAKARESLKRMIGQLMDDRIKSDQDFADEYRDFELEEFFDNLLAWIDYTHQPQNRSGKQEVPYKRAPIYHMSELLMVHPVDDGIYRLLADNFTAGMNQGINVNTMEEPLLRALIPGLNDEEVAEFFKFRDSEEEDNKFKKVDEFWKYIARFTVFRGDEAEVNRFRMDSQARGFRFVIDEESFKIRVVAEVNSASRILEAWVTISEPKKKASTPGQPGAPPPPSPSGEDGESADTAESQNSGLRITFMRES